MFQQYERICVKIYSRLEVFGFFLLPNRVEMFETSVNSVSRLFIERDCILHRPDCNLQVYNIVQCRQTPGSSQA